MRWVPVGVPFERARRLLGIREALAGVQTGVTPVVTTKRTWELEDGSRGLFGEALVNPGGGGAFVSIKLLLLQAIYLHAVSAEVLQDGAGLQYEMHLDVAESSYNPTLVAASTCGVDACTADRRARGAFVVAGANFAAQSIEVVPFGGGPGIILPTRGPRVTRRLTVGGGGTVVFPPLRLDPPMLFPLGTTPFVQSTAGLPWGGGSHVVRADFWISLADYAG